MARISRKCIEGKYFHIMVQGHNRDFIFKSKKNKEKIIKVLFDKTKGLGIKIIAYCIMGNHFHLLIEVDDVKNMSKYMARVNTSYAKYYSFIHSSVGYVFRDRYRAEPILSINQMVNCIKYIHNNPVKAHIVPKAELYQYSSINDFIKHNIDQDIIIELYGDDIDYLEKINGVYENYDFIDEEDEFGRGEKEPFEKVCQEYKDMDFSNDLIVYKVSNAFKKRSVVTNEEIYRFMGLKRTSYYNIIKRMKGLNLT